MTKKVNELLNLLREADEQLEAPAESEPAKEPGEEANREVPDAEAKALLDKDVEDLEKPMDSTLLPEEEEDPSVEPAPEQPKSGEGEGDLPSDAEVSADELASDVDPDIAEIIRLMGEAEDSEDKEEEKKEDDNEDEESSDEESSEGSEKEDEDKQKESEESDSAEPGFNDVDNVGLSDDELKDVVSQASADETPAGEERKEEDGEEKKEEEAPLPGSEELSPEQKGCLRKLFDNCVAEGVKAKLPKAVKLAESKLNGKYKELIRARDAQLNEQVSYYLKYVVETWVKRNQPRIHTGAQIKVAKKIFESVRTLVEMFDIKTVDATASIVEMYEEKVAKLKRDANRLVSENAKLVKEVSLRDRALVIEEAAKGLPLTEVERFKAVVSKIKAEDLETFKENVEAMKSSFGARPKKTESIRATNETLALQGGIKGQIASPKTEADLIASMLPTASESNK